MRSRSPSRAGGLAEGGAWFGKHWGAVPKERGLDTAGMLTAAAAGEIETLVLLGADPLSDFPDRDLVTRALERVNFLVAVDTTLNASSMLADAVLPAAGFAERDGTTTNIEGRVTRLAAKVVAPGVARSDWVIATELAERLGGDLGFESLYGIWAEIEQVAPAYSGCTGAALASPDAADGLVVPLVASPVRLGRRPRKLDPIATPGIESVEEQGAPLGAGAAVSPSVETGIDQDGGTGGSADNSVGSATPPPLLRFEAGAWDGKMPTSTLDLSGTRLVVRRGLYDHGTLVQSSASLAPLARSQELRLPAKDMERLGLEAGDHVRVRSSRGELVIAAVHDTGVPDGVALMEFNAAPIDETSASALIDSSAPLVDVYLETLT